MSKQVKKEACKHHHMDRPLVVKIVSILVIVAMLVGMPVAANSERVKFLTHEHVMSATIVDSKSGCVQLGTSHKDCMYEGCDYSEMEVTPALDHAVEGLTCTRCDQTFEPTFEVVDGKYVVTVYGKAYPEYTGFVTYEGEQWYAKDGEKNTEYQGLLQVNDQLCYISDGKMQTDYNDYYYEDGKKWYVKEGVAYDHYMGEVSFTWPTPDCWIITSYYGKRKAPVAGASTDHKGIDIGAMPGVTIVSVADGTVVETGYHDLRGNYCIVKHGDGLKSIYMHCTKVYVSNGQTVKKGEKIATVGSTGNVSGPHLHFGIYLDGTPVNPLFYLPY